MVYEYEFMGQKIRLEPDEDRVAVRFKEPAQYSTRASVSATSGLGPFPIRMELPGEKYTIIPVLQTAASRSIRHSSAMKSLEMNNDVARVAPVFKLGEQSVVATDRVLVGFKENVTKAKDIIKNLKCEIVEEREKEYLIRLPEDGNPFEFVKQLQKMKDVEYAEPDFVTIGKNVALYVPTQFAVQTNLLASGDPLLTQQYATKITKAVDAWNLQIGDPSIKIAILDEGVDTSHEDLKTAIVGSYDGTENDSFQEPNTWDAHGTACSGLAAGVPNNGMGIRGIGGGCSLLAIRIASSPAQGKDWVTSNSIISRSIDWAWQNGADVLSNSWSATPSTSVLNAFERARTQGRSGKGCVIVIAAGNYSEPVSFPGNLPNVLTVSASNEFDQFKTKTSDDGEKWWGSNFGPEIDVAAPGVHNMTTDISGINGYSKTDYIANFNGTSSATPITAGAVGLVLSANKALTESEVREIITQTADKTGTMPYVNGRNDQFGFGRLNALNAVIKAQSMNNTQSVQGTIIQFGLDKSKGAAYYLQTTDEHLFLLHRYTGEEVAARSVLETQSLTYLSQFLGTTRTVAFVRRQDTPFGSILWGTSVM